MATARTAKKKRSAFNSVKGLEWIAPPLRPLAVRVSSLTADPNNARRHPESNRAATLASLKAHGQVLPLVVQKQGRVVRIGNLRLELARDLGWTHIAAVIVDKDDVDAVALALAENRTGELAEWNPQVLLDDLKMLKGKGLLDAAGFFEDDLAAVAADAKALNAANATVEDPGPGEPPEKPVTKTGDLWIMGEHRVLCGDATKRDARKKLLDQESVFLLLADPPYGIAVVGKNGTIGAPGSFAAKSGSYRAVRGDGEDFDPAWMLDFPALSKVLFGANYYLTKLRDPGQWIVWDKGFGEGTNFSDAELAWTNGTGKATKMFRVLWAGAIRGGESGPRTHPTQKPVALYTKLMEEFSENVGVVLDPYAGSGVSVIAAETIGRVARLIEIDPAYCDVIVKRWEVATGKDATLDGTKSTFAQTANRRKVKLHS